MTTNVIESKADKSLNQEANDQLSVDESKEAEDKCDVNPEEWKLVEEEYVTMDLIGLMNESILKSCGKNDVKLVGMFNEHPVLQIGKAFFVGDREETPGTDILFQVNNRTDLSSSDEEDQVTMKERTPQPKVQLKCTTRKKLVMHQAVLTKKKDSAKDS